MHPMLNMAIKAARSAGQIIMRHLNQLDRLTVESKGRKDFVTEVDRMAENEIIRILHAAYPNHGFLGEESGVQAGDDFVWVIDPLDGTTNFLHGLPHFGVSIVFASRAPEGGWVEDESESDFASNPRRRRSRMVK